MTDEIKYSDEVQVSSHAIPGDRGNYGWPVKFDWSRKYIGINQTVDGGLVRILLSPGQAQELARFIKAKGKP